MSEQAQQANAQVAAQPQAPVTLSENDLRHHSQELGLLGKLFGSKENAPYNIAAVAIVLALVFLCVLLATQPQNIAGITLLGSIVSGGMGYIFGKSTS
jgi:hypothetical protein